MKFKSMVVLFFMLLVATFLIVGCGNGTDTTPVPGTAPDVQTDSETAPVEQKEVTLELSSTFAPGVASEVAADMFKEYVEERTDGRITVVRYPAGELYDPRSEIEAVSMGDISMGMLHAAVLGGFSAPLEFIGAFGAFGLWSDFDHYWRFFDMPEVREIADKEMQEVLGAKFLSGISGGTSLIAISNRPVSTVDDFAGLQMRTSGTAMANMYRALGVIPVELAAGEIYMGLERGIIQATGTAPNRYYTGQMYEVAPYVTLDYALPYFNHFLTMNLNVWNSLSTEDQQLIMDVSRDLELWARAASIEENEMIFEQLRNEGLVKEINILSSAEVNKLNQIVKPVMEELLIDRVGEEMALTLLDYLEKTR